MGYKDGDYIICNGVLMLVKSTGSYHVEVKDLETGLEATLFLRTTSVTAAPPRDIAKLRIDGKL